jgi:hypothetical protein
MKLIIGYVESKPLNGTTKTEDDLQEEWKGYFYACLLLIVTVVQVSQTDVKYKKNIYFNNTSFL